MLKLVLNFVFKYLNREQFKSYKTEANLTSDTRDMHVCHAAIKADS